MFSRHRENIIKRMEEVSLLLFFKVDKRNGKPFFWFPGRSLLVKTLFSNAFSRTEFKVILVFKVLRYALTVPPEFVSFSQGIVERANWKFYPSARENRDRPRGRSHAEEGEKKISFLPPRLASTRACIFRLLYYPQGKWGTDCSLSFLR